jgi:hypothetical protein
VATQPTLTVDEAMLMATTGGIESEKVVAIFRITANLRLAGQGWLGQGWTELQLV